MQVTVTGIAWFRREDYDRLKEMFKEGDKLAATFDRWLARAQGIYDRLTAEGNVVVKAEISRRRFQNGAALTAGRQSSYDIRE
jgi:hypothetical protein